MIIRDAREEDAAQLVDLIHLLDHEVDENGVSQRMAALGANGIPQLVAVDGDRVIGLCGLHLMVAIHRDRPVGRVTILVVREDARKSGVGRKMLKAAEDTLRKRGCGMIEITSNERLANAHAFYARMGYERTSLRFVKCLDL